MVRAQHEKDTFKLGDGLPIRAELIKWFRSQRQRALEHLHHLPGKRADGPTELPPNLPGFEGDTPKMVEDMTPIISAVWDKAGKRFLSDIGFDPDRWQVINPHVRGKIQNATMAFCQETNATTSKLLNQALADLRAELVTGIVDKGESLIELTKRVQKVFENAETWRARRIAATENSRARHEAELEAAIESEVVAGFEWLLSGGACALCYHIAETVKQVPLGKNFAVIGHNEHYKNIRTPPLHPGCRCSQLAILTPEYGGPTDPKWGETAVQPKVEDDGQEHEASPVPEQPKVVQPPATPPPTQPPAPPTGESSPGENPLPVSVGPTPADVAVEIKEDALEHARKLFKDPSLTPHDLASMAGAPRRSEVVNVTGGSDRIFVSVEHMDLEALQVMFYRDKQNADRMVMKLMTIRKREEPVDKDVGLAILARQVEFLSRHRVSRIELDACGSYRNLNTDRAIGYLIWAIYGFNGELNPSSLEKLKNSDLPEESRLARTIHELMASSEKARTWWTRHGGSWEGRFDLNPGSDHLRLLGNYLLERVAGGTLKNTRPNDAT